MGGGGGGEATWARHGVQGEEGGGLGWGLPAARAVPIQCRDEWVQCIVAELSNLAVLESYKSREFISWSMRRSTPGSTALGFIAWVAKLEVHVQICNRE